ncbi:hypothetical protein Btru_065903 [Bulinus truncatus]|nr:hypothetical protein Btru_065903 [Bulinus truncatus]
MIWIYKRKYKDAIEENGKGREEVIKRLKLDVVKLQEVCSRYEEKTSQSEREVEHLKTHLRSAHNEVEVKRAAVKNLETNVEELKDKQGKQLDENSRLEDKIRGIGLLP